MPENFHEMRNNRGTWAVNNSQLPALAHFMHDALPNESFDPHFYGQGLQTTYFDTRKFELRKNRLKHDKYITLRVRCYQPHGGERVYALSAKTEQEKFRVEIPALAAKAFVHADGNAPWQDWLPPNLFARMLEVGHEEDLVPVVTIRVHRYAIEDDRDRFTLDTQIYTDNGRSLPISVLEFKSTVNHQPPPALRQLQLRPIKLSKFLWATQV